jgi:DNA-binding NarL/FixJ family response regulator
MLDCVAILEPPQRSFGELADAFAAVLHAGARVERESSLDALTQLVGADANAPLLVVHEASTDGDVMGLELMPELRERFGDAAVVVVAEGDDVLLAQRAVQAGAADLLVLGPRLEERVGTLVGKLDRLFEVIDRIPRSRGSSRRSSASHTSRARC